MLVSTFCQVLSVLPDLSFLVCLQTPASLPLVLQPHSRDGRLIASSVSEAAAAGGGAATPGGRGGGGGGSNAFTLFVKSHFADLKRSLPTGTPHKEVGGLGV